MSAKMTANEIRTHDRTNQSFYYISIFITLIVHSLLVYFVIHTN